ncbi:acyltransferase family protein [Massilia endophytica]|uniref:acyltransferase family protein n=1 Tax=Massilia endophytica TaxID=2899220 RepID=UPI001E46DD16|nr:acyltransferase [Massilia endophytica]UGQ47641.1 acyltransferase [Massilia endophytica]
MIARADNNNFNPIRLAAAWLVLFSHSYHLSGLPYAEPLMRLTGNQMTFGTFAVGVFFAISGYLITGSAYSRSSLRSFLDARIRRIFPALIAVLLLTALVLGPLMTLLPLSDYFASSAVATYVLRNAALLRLQYELPGVFAGNPYGAAVNGSLWTLPIEFGLYLAVGAAVWLLRRTGQGGSRLLPGIAAAAACLLAWGLLLSGRSSGTYLLIPYFMVGALCQLWRGWLPLHGGAAAALGLLWAAAAAFELPGFAVFACLAISYGALWIGRHPRWILPFSTERWGDLSYGVYLYAFPIQQTLVALGVAGPAAVTLAATPLVLACAWLSWHLVEARCLAPRRRGSHPVPAPGVAPLQKAGS